MIEINLLPPRRKGIEKETQILILCLLLWVCCTAYTGFLYFSNKKQEAMLYAQLSAQQKLIYDQNKKNQETSTVSVDDYMKLADSLQNLFYPTTTLMDELAHNLPANAKLTQIAYSLDGKVTLTGTFGEYDQIAAYLHNIQLSPYVITASIKSISENNQQSGSNKSSGSLILLPKGIGVVMPQYNATIEAQMITIDTKKPSAKPNSPGASK
ncbi:PilN domain-containing protein [Aneurinibacillus sp. Ricciae_BoGa-3]|uniref:PilN domain-containing protein n=1 Tax=Aneurinibacillus sp. Ricciae_BoGa-3 TaxID=3022697 RepID=UPI002341D9B5|nr:PilN domain-containing protein [Aneurinibacillus sp. Ricciae_BoGa-3]WCK53647.1 PilN domain-containing protein [Aneurinibacillus sp. Ricciae_BoGa-3]